MMKKVLGMLAITVCCAGLATAQTLTAGTQELVVGGLLDPDTAADTQFDLSVKYGYFVADYLEVGGAGAISDNDAVSTYGIGGFVEYNFDLGTEVVPYVGAGLGWLNADYDIVGEDEDAIEFSGYGGVKYFIAQNIAISGELEFDWASEEIYLEDDDIADTNIQLNLGMRFFFE